MVDKLVGDEVIGLYIPGMARPEHSRKAITAAQRLLRATGHRELEGPWLPVGIGVLTGLVFAGVVGGTDDNPTDFIGLGDNVNVASRLASKARMGEILISDAAYVAAGLDLGELEQQQLELKGKRELTGVRVLRISAA